jgi:uncharacterized CHY-type Zn-finger protein
MKKPLDNFKDSFSKHLFGRARSEAIQSNVCVTCGGLANAFVDQLSAKEYTISRMCQKCQDDVFGTNEGVAQ